MKFNKQIVVILILASLLVSAVGVSIFLFLENEKSKNISNEIVTIYVAKNDIKKNFLIKSSDIKKTTIAKKYLLNNALLHREIINKYAKIDIYKNETFIKEKLQKDKFQEKVRMLEFKDTSYNISFSLFSNANLSLNVGEYINIISVYPKSLKRDNLKYKVQYVASEIKILGFLEKGKTVPKTYRVVKEKVKVKKAEKEEQYKLVTKYADELVLDVKKHILLNLIKDYNKGKQLWMVKTNHKPLVEKEPEVKPIIIAPKVVEKVPVKVAKKVVNKAKQIKKVKKVKKVYPYKMYLPKDTTFTRTAIIEYEDSSIPNISQHVNIKINLQQQCMLQKKVLVGISREVLLRSIPSLKGRIKKIVQKNYIIPYKSKVDNNWFEVCDGRFVHKNETKMIDYKTAQGLLSGKSKSKNYWLCIYH